MNIRFRQRGMAVLATALTISCAAFGGGRPPEERLPLPSLAQAVEAYYGGRIETALAYLERLAAEGDFPPAYQRELAALYAEIGEYSRSLQLLKALRETHPGDAELARELFITLCLASRGAEARALLPLAAENAESVFFEAMLAEDSGESQAAERLFEKSLALDDFRPLAWYRLGMLRAARGDLPRAEAALAQALRQDANLTAALPALAEAVLAQGRIEDAYALLLRARVVLPAHAGVSGRIAEIEAARPELPARRAAAAIARRAALPAPRVEHFTSDAGDVPLVRVGLAEGLGSLSIRTGGTYRLGSSESRLHGGSDELLTIKRDPAGGLLVLNADGVQVLSSAHALSLDYEDASAATVVFDLLSEAGTFFAVREDRSYRGRLEFLPTAAGLTLVNELNIEEYLYSVVPSEMPASWPAEALQAQAVAARSYTLAYLGRFEERGFDLFGSVRSAAYRGLGGEARAARAAVDATRGLVLTAGGRPLPAYYSANSGGHTEDSVSVWGADAFMQAVADPLIGARTGPLPLHLLSDWIRARPDSYSARAPFFSRPAYRWEHWVPAAELAARNSDGGDLGRIMAVVSRGRGLSGRVNEVELIGSAGRARIAGDRIRSRLGGLRSNLFFVHPKLGADGLPEYFVFRGAGWGHGVGLCQSGAAGMAAAGHDARAILRHFYPRAEFVQYY